VTRLAKKQIKIYQEFKNILLWKKNQSKAHL